MAAGTWTTRGRDVLVSSEDEMLFQRTARLLEGAMFSVARTTAGELRTRLAKARAAEVCLVIVDARGADERQVFGALRRKGPVPILALGDAARMAAARASGAHAFVCLPLEDDELLFEVARLTGQELHG